MAINRKNLQDEFIRATIDGMDLDDMYRTLYDLLEEKVSACSDAELIEDVEEYYPELLEEGQDTPVN